MRGSTAWRQWTQRRTLGGLDVRKCSARPSSATYHDSDVPDDEPPTPDAAEEDDDDAEEPPPPPPPVVLVVALVVVVVVAAAVLASAPLAPAG